MPHVDVVLYQDGNAEIQGVDYRTLLHVVSVEIGGDSTIRGAQGTLVLKAPTARFSKGYKQGVETVPAKYLVLYIIARLEAEKLGDRWTIGTHKLRCQFVTDFLVREKEWEWAKTAQVISKIPIG